MKNPLTQSNRRRLEAGVFPVLSVVLLFASSANADPTSSDEIAILQNERIAVLEELVKVRRQDYSEGLSSFGPVFPRAVNI